MRREMAAASIGYIAAGGIEIAGGGDVAEMAASLL